MRGQFNNEEDIIESLKKGGKKSNDALTFLYQKKVLKQRIRNFVIYNGGSTQDAHDIFTESLITFERNVRKKKFRNQSAIDTYIYGIAKLCWNKVLVKRRSKVVEDIKEAENIPDVANPELIMMEKQKKDLVMRLLDLIDKKCRQILKYWSQNYSFDEIKDLMGMTSSSAVRKKKFYCKKRMIELIQDHHQIELNN